MSDDKAGWHGVLQKCFMLVVITGCAAVLNLLMANTPSADDALRGGLLAALGSMATSMLRN